MTQQTHETNPTDDGDRDGTQGARREDRGTAPGAQTTETPAPLWYGDPAPWRAPSADYDPFGRPDPARESAPGGGEPISEGFSGGAFSSGYAAPPAPPAGAAADGGAPTSEVPMPWSPTSPAYPGGTAFGGDGGWGGPPGVTPPPSPAGPQPKQRNGRRIAELSAVALIAAVLATGGTFAATRYNQVAAPVSTNQTNNVPAPVIQASNNNPDWTATAKAVSPSVVSITVTSQQAQGQGSGVIIDAKGHILTNNHVATGAGTGATITVSLSDARTYDATIVGTDPTTDLAVLSITNPPSDLTPISIGSSDALAVGQPVMAVGNPLGLAGTVTTGIVSALNRPVTTAASESSPSQGSQGQNGQGQNGQSQDQSNDVVTNAIQTSAAINPGNSGGALVTASGQLVGINSSIASLGASSSGAQSGSIGIGFAIPVKEAKSIADQLIATGSAKHAYLGVSAKDTTVTANGSKRAGALIDSLSAGTPAAAAGFKKGDAVIAIDGNSIESSKSLVATIHEYSVGEKVTVTVIRGGAKQDLQVTLAARPGQG